ncbi:MAG: dihydrodipicolinate synthase family protein [Promethearchaeota archaeon]
MDREFQGVVVPILSIFNKNYRINFKAQVMLTKHVLINGADVIFICGSTGEGQFIQKNRPDERKTIISAIKTALDDLNVEKKVIIGIYGDSTREIHDQFKEVKKITSNFAPECIDGFVISPPINKNLSRPELKQFLTLVLNEISEPIFIYNNPNIFGGNNIPLEFYDDFLSKFDHVRGIKDSSSSLEYKRELISLIKDHENTNFYTGREGDFFNCLQEREADNAWQIGCVPSIGNILNLPSRIRGAYVSNEIEMAKSLQDDLNKIRNRIYHAPASPGKAQRGVKFALSYLYKGSSLDIPVVVSPQYEKPMTRDDKDSIENALNESIDAGYIEILEKWTE